MKSSLFDWIILILLVIALGWLIYAGVIYSFEHWDKPDTKADRFRAFWKPGLLIVVIAIITSFRKK